MYLHKVWLPASLFPNKIKKKSTETDKAIIIITIIISWERIRRRSGLGGSSCSSCVFFLSVIVDSSSVFAVVKFYVNFMGFVTLVVMGGICSDHFGLPM